MPSTSESQRTAAGTVLCGGCRGHGHCRLGVGEIELVSDTIAQAPVTCAPAFHAGPRVAHGGWTAAMFDDVIGRALTQRGLKVVTASLTVDFLRPVPIEEPLIVEILIDGREGRRWSVAATLRLLNDDAQLARASGIWVERRDDHFDRHELQMEAYRAMNGDTDA